MRAIVSVLCLVFVTATAVTADARDRRPDKHAKLKRKATATDTSAKEPKKQRVDRVATRIDHSVGAPWSGHLQAPVKFASGKRYFLRRPWRTFGTRTTVSFVRTAIADTLAAFPKVHTLAIGDFSQQAGGFISQHRSHQSGRDVDIGLFYKQKPKGYPDAFVVATPATLDAGAMWRLVSSLARTHDEDGGVQMIFFDQALQAVLIAWADTHGVSETRINAVKQVFRHIPNHANHIHVRFKCRERDTSCQ